MKNRTLILLAVLALSLVACNEMTQKYSEVEEQTFTVGNSPTLQVENFAGDVTLRIGESETMRVIATKRAARESNLDDIDVDIVERENGLEIKTDPPSGLKNVSVNLEITVPADSSVKLHTGAGEITVPGLEGRVEVDTGAGEIEIRDVRGTIEAHTGAGEIDVRDTIGPVRLDTGAGDINYEGWPEGECRFDTGAGSIKLRLPKDIDAQVNLEVGVGDIEVDLPVEGQISKRKVHGTLGNGEGTEIRAHSGAGDIDLLSQ